jgi:hypothetical protein
MNYIGNAPPVMPTSLEERIAALEARAPAIGVPVTLAGTSVDFAIPAWARNIKLSFAGLSLNAAAELLAQLGDAGGIENTGYLGASSTVSSVVATSNYTAGAGIRMSGAATITHGSLTFTLLDAATNLWGWHGVAGTSSGGNTAVTAGSKALSQPLTTVRLTSTTGTDTFDAGTGNVAYW